ncbi:hypothetical protein [Ruania rhizosphaerae]|nr:hypothetical protein [Ruania rhizosphaerae]
MAAQNQAAQDDQDAENEEDVEEPGERRQAVRAEQRRDDRQAK